MEGPPLPCRTPRCTAALTPRVRLDQLDEGPGVLHNAGLAEQKSDGLQPLKLQRLPALLLADAALI